MYTHFRLVLLLGALCSATLSFAQPKIQLQDFASGFVRPVDIAHCGDSRLFIVEQRGVIWIVDSLGNKSAEPFLDIDARVRFVQNEQGLLGLAFDPDYATNGYFYVYYTRETDYDTHVSRFSRDPLNPNKADPNSELILLYQDQPYTNHNAGCMKFGPDGYLYIALGDGGSANDPQNYGQTKNTFLGKILRIDVGVPGQPYVVPADNPFVNDPTYKPEIWSLGWRNPWRFSFDRLTGDMWVADVGQSAREEICFEPAGTGGRNYGWRCYEGFNNFNQTGCQPPGAYTRPVFDYPNPSMGCSVTGGFVYRGTQYPDLYGYYLFTDYCSGRWWATRQTGDSTFSTQMLENLVDYQYSTLGEDYKGELYVASLSAGKIQRITELCSSFQLEADITPALCEGALNGIIDLNISGGVGNLGFNWSANANGQTDSLIVYLNPGEYTVTATNGNGCIRTASFTVPAENTIPAPILNVAAGDTLPPLCEGEQVVISTQTPPAGLSVEWYRNGVQVPGANSSSLVVTEAGAYSALFTDGICDSGYSWEVTITVSAVTGTPSISLASGQTDLCAGETAVLSAAGVPAGVNLQWFKNGTPLSGATTSMFEVSETGSYAVLMTDGVCSSPLSNAISITVADAIPVPEISLSAGQATLCPGESATLMVQSPPAGAAIQWFNNDGPVPGANTTTLEVNSTGVYTVQFTEGNCASEVSTAFSITVLDGVTSPAIVISAGQSVLCPGETTTLTAQAPPSGVAIEWYFNGNLIEGASQFTLQVDEPGAYSAVYTNGLCTSETSDDLMIDAEVITPWTIQVSGDTLDAGAWSSYQWLLNGLPIPGATEAVYVATETGFYECRVTSVNGCTYTDGVQIIISQTRLPQSVRAFTLSPNPTNGLFTMHIELQQSKDFLVTLTDKTQRLIFQQSMQGQTVDKTIDLRGLPAGVYILLVQVEHEMFTRQVVKR